MTEKLASDQRIPPDAQDVLRCTYCDTEVATHFCRTCTDELCPSCKNFHVKSKVAFGHEIVSITEKHQEAEKIKKCIIHQKKVYFAGCVVCKLPVCTECVNNKHNGHQIGDMSKIFKEEKEKAKTTLSQMKKKIRSDGLDISSAREGMLQIEKWFEDKRQEFKKEGESLKEKVEQLVNENIKKSREDEREQKRIFEKIEEQNTTALEDLILRYEENLSKCHPADLLVFLKGHVPNPEKIDIYPRLPALSVENVCTITCKLKHQPKPICAESIIKIKSSSLNETEWIEILYSEVPHSIKTVQYKEPVMLAASIIIGSSHSCAAFQYLHIYQQNPLRINQFPSSSNFVVHNRKTDQIYAEEKVEMRYDYEEDQDLMNFSVFKEMKITASLLKHSTIEAEDGSTMEFLTFYTKIVDFWRNKIFITLEKHDVPFDEKDILWVLSLPPPWDSTSERLLSDYLVQKNFSSHYILSSETAILRYCEVDSSNLKILNGNDTVQFSEGDRILYVQSEVKFADITEAIVRENRFISLIKKKRDMTLNLWYIGQRYLTEISNLLEMNRDDLHHLIDERSLLEDLSSKCRLCESSLQKKRQKLRCFISDPDKILEKSDFSKFVKKTGPIISFRSDILWTTCTMLPSLLKELGLRLSQEIKKLLLEDTPAYIIVLGEFASWPIVLETLRDEFPKTCILVPNGSHLSIIAAGSVIHGHMKKKRF